MVDGRLARVLPRFKPADIGSVAFWRAANDISTVMDQANCLAQQFLVDREYVPPEDVSFLERCALSDIRMPAR